MDHPELNQLNIEISAADASEEDIDWMTRQLLSELRELDVESVELAKGEAAPAGTKGDFTSIGSIALELAPTVLPSVVGLVQAWVSRPRRQAINVIKFKGMGIEFEGSPEELQKLLTSLQAGSLLHEKPSDEKGQASDKLASAPAIFISYRRADSADVAGRIYDRLVMHFGELAIFKDVDSIPLGIDFKEHLEKAVGECKIFLVVIGDEWLGATESGRKTRLQDPADFVRIEVEAALSRKDILVVPLLVRGASMPAEKKLPPSLQKLIYRNAMQIRPDPDFHRDMDRLIEAIESYAEKNA
jgi:hypothetical protein